MRIATIHGRVALIDGTGGGTVDVETASGGRFGPESAGVYERWTEFATWARSAPLPPSEALEPGALGSPSPNPRQVFAIGLNYSAHAAESGFARPDTFAAGLHEAPILYCWPVHRHRLPPCGHTDWEVELVVVIGPAARQVAAADGWRYVAGVSGGQDVSERRLQMAATPPQFSPGKSFPGFRPVGPWLVAADEFDNPDDLGLGCSINCEPVQAGHSRDSSSACPSYRAALPGHAVAARRPHLHRHSTGRRDGRNPPRWLAPCDVLTSYIEGIGEMRHRFVASGPRGLDANSDPEEER